MNPETAPQLRPIAELNQLAVSVFADAVRPLFEAAGPLAGALHVERPFTSYADLIDRAEIDRLAIQRLIGVSHADQPGGLARETVRTLGDDYVGRAQADEAPIQVRADAVDTLRALLAQEVSDFGGNSLAQPLDRQVGWTACGDCWRTVARQKRGCEPAQNVDVQRCQFEAVGVGLGEQLGVARKPGAHVLPSRKSESC